MRLAFLVTLPVLLVSGLILLIALRTYAPDVAAALASSERGAPRQDPGPAAERDADGAGQEQTR